MELGKFIKNIEGTAQKYLSEELPSLDETTKKTLRAYALLSSVQHSAKALDREVPVEEVAEYWQTLFEGESIVPNGIECCQTGSVLVVL